MKNPFAASVFHQGAVTAPSIHRRELESLVRAAQGLLEAPWAGAGDGDSLLLTAPRAGFGKSHLLARLEEAGSAEFFTVRIHCVPGQSWDWRERTLTLASRLFGTTADDGSSALETVAWFAFSRVVGTGLDLGKVTSGNLEGSRAVLDQRYREMFSPSAAENHSRWFLATARSLFASCGPRCAASMSCDGVALHWWLRRFLAFGYSGSSREQNWERLQAALSDGGPGPSSPVWKQRFQVLARLASGVRPLIWVADDLDRFFADPHGARQLIAAWSELAALAPRSLLVISANQDLWTQCFVPGTPSALLDRLAAREIMLAPIPTIEAEELLAARVATTPPRDEAARRRVYQLDLATGRPTTPRSVLRLAAGAWEGGATDTAPPEASASMRSVSDTRGAQRAREELHAIAEALKQQSGPPAALQSGSAPAAAAPALQPAPPTTLAEHFQALRLRHFGTGDAALDLRRIHRLVSAVGQRFPSIRQRVFDQGPGMNGEALCWEVAGREIYIGFAPPTGYRFWRQLAADAGREAPLNRPRRLVMLAPPGQTISLDRLTTDPAGIACDLAIDVVPIDADLAASLLAADELIQTAGRAGSEFQENRLNSFLAKELDFFWRRLTRFPQAGAAPGRIADQTLPA
jgi:hypothetical protein